MKYLAQHRPLVLATPRHRAEGIGHRVKRKRMNLPYLLGFKIILSKDTFNPMLYALCPMLLYPSERSLRKDDLSVLKPLRKGTLPVFVVLVGVIEPSMDVHALDLPALFSLQIPP